MKRKAFSLVELLIASALTATLLVMIFWSLGSVLKQYQRLVLKGSHDQLKALVLARVSRDLQEDLPVKYTLIAGRLKRELNGSAAYLTDYREINKFTITPLKPDLLEVTLDELIVKIAKRN